MHPGPTNFLFLQQMYGTVDDTATESNDNSWWGGNGNGGGRSLVRRRSLLYESAALSPDMRDQILKALKEIEECPAGLEHALEGWVEDGRNGFRSRHRRNFAQYTVRVTKLLLNRDNDVLNP